MLLLSSLALADIPPDALPGRTLAQNTVSVAGLDAHPDVVLLLYTGSTELGSHQVLSSERAATQLSDTLLQAGFWLMTKADYSAWSVVTSAEIARQEAACSERGEGCVHISRFTPSYAPPTTAISCGVTLDAPYDVPTGEPSQRRHAFTLSAASATVCTLTATPPVEASSANPPQDVGSGASLPGGCATARGGAMGAILLPMMVLGWRRRCGS
ncbi:MAG: hypothetical protein P8R54_33450 [Myxococcota bacterium]|nr:hypothetical protein [Myxococcota bacterium]